MDDSHQQTSADPTDATSQAVDNSEKKSEKNRKVKSKKKKKGSPWWSWPLKAFVMTLVLSAAFSFAGEILSTKGGLVAVIIVVVVLVAISILFDAIGTAFASCDPTPFYSLASRKVKGAKTSLALLKKADVVSNICNDVIGDICGIVSGAAGAGIVLNLALTDHTHNLIASIIVSSVISAITVGGKALFKRIALSRAQNIVSGVGKFLSVFSKNK